MLVVAAQRLLSDLFEISVAGKHHAAGVVLHILSRCLLGHFVRVDDLSFAGLSVFFLYLRKLSGNDRFKLDFVRKYFLYIFNIRLQAFYLVNAVYKVLVIQMAELDFRNILCLHAVNRKAFHKIRHNIAFLFSLADNLYRLVNIKKHF